MAESGDGVCAQPPTVTEIATAQTTLRIDQFNCQEKLKELFGYNQKPKYKCLLKKEKIPRFHCKNICKHPTLTQIRCSSKYNCRFCCRLIRMYLKESCRLLCSFVRLSPATDTQFREMAYDFISIICCMGRDCCLLLRYMLRLICPY